MKKTSRTSNSIKNSLTSLISNITAIFVGFVAQAVFVRILNAEYLGLNGLFTNILTMLSFFELGIGNAIVFCMYKPLAEKNNDQIKALMQFYKNSYRIIAIVIFLVGMALMPFIEHLVSDITVDVNLKLIYFLFLVSTVVSYLMAYKLNMLYADQRNYIINIIHCAYLVLLNISQLLLLYFTKNYYLYLGIKIICQILENVVITIIVNKLYPFLKDKNVKNLDSEIKRNIFNKFKALIFHKVGYIIVNGTDNIIISKFLGVIYVGLYSNYYLIVNAVYTMFNQVITSLTSSVGSLLINEKTEKIYDTFKKIRFINFCISCFSATAILIMMQPFICVWVGEEYLLSFGVLSAITFNFFQKMQRSCYMTFKDSAGIWEEDRIIPLVESIFNIVFSIICLKIFGLAGVFIGTIISGLTLWCYSYPRFVYKKLFKRNYYAYTKETVGYIILFIAIAAITYFLSNLIVVDNIFIKLMLNVILCLAVPNLLLYIFFRKTDNFIYFKSLLFKILNRVLKKENIKNT